MDSEILSHITFPNVLMHTHFCGWSRHYGVKRECYVGNEG